MFIGGGPIRDGIDMRCRRSLFERLIDREKRMRKPGCTFIADLIGACH